MSIRSIQVAKPDPGLARLRNQSALIRGRLDALKGKKGDAASRQRTQLNKQLVEVRTKISNWKNVKKMQKSATEEPVSKQIPRLLSSQSAASRMNFNQVLRAAKSIKIDKRPGLGEDYDPHIEIKLNTGEMVYISSDDSGGHRIDWSFEDESGMPPV
jgi:hypothetical protein